MTHDLSLLEFLGICALFGIHIEMRKLVTIRWAFKEREIECNGGKD